MARSSLATFDFGFEHELDWLPNLVLSLGVERSVRTISGSATGPAERHVSCRVRHGVLALVFGPGDGIEIPLPPDVLEKLHAELSDELDEREICDADAA